MPVLPNHELVVTAVGDVVDIGGREEIVGDIGVDVGVAVGPRDRGGNAADLADQLLVEGDARVGVGLDVGVATAPVPGGGPGDAVAGDGVHGGALGAGAGVLAPKVVTDRVGTRLPVAILVTELSQLGAGHGQDGGQGNSRLHGEMEKRCMGRMDYKVIGWKDREICN